MKKFKMIIASVLVFVMSASMLYGCAPKATTDPATSTDAGASADGSAAGKSYNFGINTWGSGVPILDLFGDEAVYSVETLGSTYIRASDDFTSDKELMNIQNFCSAGVDGIVMQASAITTFPQMAQVCLDAKVPFVTDVFIGTEADIEKISANNPYYVGAATVELVNAGAQMADSAIRDGCKTALIIGGNIGDMHMDARTQGFTDEFVAKGGTVLATARCTDPSESATKAEDMLSANKEADCIYALVGDYVPAAVSAVDKLGLTGDTKIYASCVDKTTADYIKQDLVVEGNDGIGLSPVIAPTLLLNYLDGHQILDENGKAPTITTIPFIVDKDNVDAYVSVFYTEGVHPITEEVLKTLCYRYNPDVTYQTYLDLVNNGLDLNSILKAHNLPTVD